MKLALSFVVPMYNAASTIEAVVRDIEELDVPGGHEIVLVDDCGGDNTLDVCRRLVTTVRDPDHGCGARAKLRRAQRRAHRLAPRPRPPHRQSRRRWAEPAARGAAAMAACRGDRQGRRLRPLRGQAPLGVPQFRQLAHQSHDRLGARQAARVLPFELPLRQRVHRAAGASTTPDRTRTSTACCCRSRRASIRSWCRTRRRKSGESGYTLRRLIRLWLSAWLNFSLLPLRVATLAGFATATVGMIAFVVVLWLWSVGRGPQYGFGWIMSALLIFSGLQLVMLGLIGEYLGRMFLTVNQRPQSVSGSHRGRGQSSLKRKLKSCAQYQNAR